MKLITEICSKPIMKINDEIRKNHFFYVLFFIFFFSPRLLLDIYRLRLDYTSTIGYLR